MSSYENYTETSKNYDRTREPVGTEVIVGCMAHAPVPLHETTVLDAGCGTGSYSAALLGYVGKDRGGGPQPRHVGGRRGEARRRQGGG